MLQNYVYSYCMNIFFANLFYVIIYFNLVLKVAEPRKKWIYHTYYYYYMKIIIQAKTISYEFEKLFHYLFDFKYNTKNKILYNIYD